MVPIDPGPAIGGERAVDRRRPPEIAERLIRAGTTRAARVVAQPAAQVRAAAFFHAG
jgi:hypothetical protein